MSFGSRCTMSTDDLKRELTRRTPKLGIRSELLSSGSTVLNLACSGYPFGGIPKGCYVLLAGDSESGKTWLALTMLAEAATDYRFADYRFILDEPENGAMMDRAFFFGKKMAKRLEPPARFPDGRPKMSSTVQEFYYHLDDCRRIGTPVIYILDSMDALDSEEDEQYFQKKRRAANGEKEEDKTKGTYGTAKAKTNSAGIRRLNNFCRDSGSIVVVLSQTRDNIGFGSQYNPKTRSGGRAMKFYAHLEIWTSVREEITKVIRGKNRQLGTLVQCRIKKDRVTGKHRSVELPIYHSHGIDDIGACIDYLVGEKHWKLTKGTISTPELDYNGNVENLVRHIEKNGLEKVLQSLTAEVWHDIEEASKVRRKPRYR